MFTAQLGASFVVWIACGIFTAKRTKPARREGTNPAAAAALGALLFVLSAVALVGGLWLIAQSSGPIRGSLSSATWAAVTALGALCTIGQAEAAGLVLASAIARSAVTDKDADSSASSGSSNPHTLP